MNSRFSTDRRKHQLGFFILVLGCTRRGVCSLFNVPADLDVYLAISRWRRVQVYRSELLKERLREIEALNLAPGEQHAHATKTMKDQVNKRRSR